MKKRALEAFFLCLLLSVLAPAQVGNPTPHERASHTFAAADRNLDGVLDAREIAQVSIPPSAAKTSDHDQDGNLSKDEFLMYYRQLMVNAGQAPGAELNTAARRIESWRRAEEARAAERRAREKELAELRRKQTTKETTAERLRRAQEALRERVRQADESSEATETSTDRIAERAREALGAGSGAADAGASAATAKRLARAGAALGGSSAPPEGSGSGSGSGNRAGSNRVDLARALLALEKRAQDGGWTREQYDRERKALIERARNERAGKREVERRDVQGQDARKQDAGKQDAGKQVDVRNQEANKKKTDPKKATNGARGDGGTKPPERKDTSGAGSQRGSAGAGRQGG